MYSRLSDTATNLSVLWSPELLTDVGKPAGGRKARQADPSPQVSAFLQAESGRDFSAGHDGVPEAIQVSRSSEQCSLTARHEYNTLRIRVLGVLDIGAYDIFRACYESLPQARHYVVELAGARHIDSAGLAMLLLLRDHAGGDRERITLLNPRKAICQMLRDVNFDGLFRIE